MVAATFLLLAGCATRPINPPITQTDPSRGYRFETRQAHAKDTDNLVVLAFSGGGTRAAAFSYGVLEFLRRTEIVGPKGNKVRLLDEVDIITGVSGGSFTALAYGLYGDKLFTEYEQRFLKRNVQGEIVARAFNPIYWEGWRRLRLGPLRTGEAQIVGRNPANGGATFERPRPWRRPVYSSLGHRYLHRCAVHLQPGYFRRYLLGPGRVQLPRAATALTSRAVVSSIGDHQLHGSGRCISAPAAKPFIGLPESRRPAAARAVRSFRADAAFGDSVHRPYLHLVDGGVADNVGMRAVLDALEILESLHDIGAPTPLDSARRIIVFVVNSQSSPPTNWDESETPPGTVDILLKAAGTPIDSYSYESVELLKDTATRWQTLRRIRDSAAMKANADPAITAAMRVPNAEIYAIDVSFAELKDESERDYLNRQPTSFVLPAEAVDPAGSGTIINGVTWVQRLIRWG